MPLITLFVQGNQRALGGKTLNQKKVNHLPHRIRQNVFAIPKGPNFLTESNSQEKILGSS